MAQAFSDNVQSTIGFYEMFKNRGNTEEKARRMAFNAMREDLTNEDIGVLLNMGFSA